ncbi:hypothetical protein KSP40_PGU015643 [Platanthera guangdongensis]|uniref:Prolactin receptor n=1 Tax=Platanthera guangdongensis TaxID=2320717 RepID=A0ABR2LYG7_9ASPA
MVLQADGDPKNGDGDIIRGSPSPKKPKPNKIPQRGLGIAALEKLRTGEEQRRIAGSFSADESICSAASWNSIQNENSLNPNSRLPLPLRKPPEHHHHHHQVMKNFLSSPSSSGACLQMEPPSNQSYLSINPPLIPDENKRSWPFQTGTSCSSSSRVPKFDGSLLSLSLLPPSDPNSMPTISSQKHYIQVIKLLPKNTEEKISEAADQPTLYNFMGLPHDLIESNPSETDPEFKAESEYTSLK